MQHFQSDCSIDTPAPAPPGIFSVKHRKIRGGESNCFTMPSRFFPPWIQHSKIKPGAGSGNCTAFYDVLQVPLRSFLVPRVASPHDYAAFSKVLWKEIPAAEKQKIHNVTGLPMIPCLPEISTESFGWYHILSFYSFLILHFPNCQINTQSDIYRWGY